MRGRWASDLGGATVVTEVHFAADQHGRSSVVFTDRLKYRMGFNLDDAEPLAELIAGLSEALAKLRQ